LICIHFVPAFNEELTRSLGNFSGYSNGKNIGRLLAIPLFALIYLMLSTTIGNKNNFQRKVEAFMQYPDEIKKKANAKLLIPFFVLLAVVVYFSLLK
jgi:hypothetical protein